MRGKLGDKARIGHILEAIDEVENYLKGSEYIAFMENSMMRFACVKQVEIIGEACTYLSNELKDNFPEIEWKQIRGMRNIFVHEYFGIDSEILWEIVKYDLPELRIKIKKIEDSL